MAVRRERDEYREEVVIHTYITTIEKYTLYICGRSYVPCPSRGKIPVQQRRERRETRERERQVGKRGGVQTQPTERW